MSDDQVLDGQPDWKEGISEDLRGHSSLENVKDVSTLAKNYVNAQELIGRKGVVLPKNNDDTEGWKAVYKQLGRPDNSSDYSSPEIQIEDNLKQYIDPSKIDGFKEIAHKHGLTQKQFENITKEYTETQVTNLKNALQAQEDQTTVLKDALTAKWGEKSKDNFELANKVVDNFGKDMDESIQQAIKANPHMAELLANVGSQLSDDSFELSSGGSGESLESVNQKINEMLTDQKGAFRNAMHEDHDTAVKEFRDLHTKKSELEAKRKSA